MADYGSGKYLTLKPTIAGKRHHSLCTVLTLDSAAICLRKNSAQVLTMHPQILIVHPT